MFRVQYCLSLWVRHCLIPLLVFSFRLCELLKESWSLKSFKAEVGESGRKKTGQDSKKLLCFGDWLCQKGFLLEDSEGLVGGWWGAEGAFGGLGRDVNYGFWEKEVCKGLLGSLIVATPRAFLWLCCTQATKRGFLHLFIQFHAMSTPKWPHSLSKTALSLFVAGHPNPLPKKRDP